MNNIQGVEKSILKQILVAKEAQMWVMCKNVHDDDFKLKISCPTLIRLTLIKI